MKYKIQIVTATLALTLISACSSPKDVADLPVRASFASSGQIATSTSCVRGKLYEEGTFTNSYVGIDLFPTQNGTELHVHTQGNYRAVYAIAFYTKTSSGYSVEIKGGPEMGRELASWVKACVS